MSVFKRLFEFYISGSLHVALAVLALVMVTNEMFDVPFDFNVAGFVFFGSVFGYNFVKYEYLFRLQKARRELIEVIAIFSFVALAAAVFFFFRLEYDAKMTVIAASALLFLYAVPLFSNWANLRNLAGIKIYIVAVCWSLMTVLLPLLSAGYPFTTEIFLKCIQRFLLILVLILIFEIIDLKTDHPSLRTVPQQIGVKRTKILAVILMVAFFLLEFLRTFVDPEQLVENLCLSAITILFIAFANQDRPKHYTTFWVEAIPIFWLLMMWV